MDEKKIKQTYEMAKEQYSLLGSDVDGALEELKKFSISLHCWQGDDVGGFETPGSELSGGGIQVTGRYPGKARSLDELRSDLEKAFSLIPGRHRLNLHAIYGDFSGDRIDRDAVEARHFRSWVDWAKKFQQLLKSPLPHRSNLLPKIRPFRLRPLFLQKLP